MCDIDWVAFWAAVQAIGSIAAIIAAIWVGSSSDKRARSLVEDERHRQATIAASSLALRLENVADEAHKKAISIESIRKTIQGDTVTLKEDTALHMLFLLTKENLKSEFRAWTLLFDKHNGIAASVALDYVETYNFTVDNSIKYFLATGKKSEEFNRLCIDVIERLEAVEEELRKVVCQLEVDYDLIEA